MARACLSDSWRTSRGASWRPKVCTRRMVSSSLPPASAAWPVSQSEACMAVKSSNSSSLSKMPSVEVRAPINASGDAAHAAVSRRRATTMSIKRLYGSWARFGELATPARWTMSELAVVTDKSRRKASSSAMKSSAPLRRCAATTCAVTCAVTFGFPSRSPPIHVAKATGTASRGKAPPCCASVASNLRRNCGTAAHSDVSITAKAPRASFCGVGLDRRSSSLPHRARTVAARSRSSSSFSKPLPPPSASSWSRSVTRRCFTSSVRRCTSVGCAVKTISTRCFDIFSTTSPIDLPSPSKSATVPGHESTFNGNKADPSTRFVSRRRRRCSDSAAFERARKCANARDTSRSCAASREATDATIFEKRSAARTSSPSRRAERQCVAPLRRDSIAFKVLAPSTSPAAASPSNFPNFFISRA
mmetsp:Transcript_14122/g.47121  ORF Transcript_14122/g.47121 Transcript_14122/m.47121 type:complete len:418 (-) Transcript_14122:298-1551(-)